MKKVAINGFGRIGRLIVRHYLNDPPQNIEIVAANDPNPLEDLAYLIGHDSVHGKPAFPVGQGAGYLQFGSRKVSILSDRDPARLPWKELGVDYVLECTGHFTAREGAAKHLEGGASRVIISAPSKDADLTVVLGVNEKIYRPDRHTIVSNASCTTNALAPTVKVLHENFGVEHLMATAVHAYTASQALVDRASKRMRRGRAAAVSLIPSTTGAAIATTKVLPELEGRMEALSIRTPVPDGSLLEVTAQLRKDVTTESINAAMKRAAEGDLKGILGYTEEELVSADIVGDPHSGIVDANSTKVVNGRMARLLVWYDNEWGYARRMLDLASYMASKEE